MAVTRTIKDRLRKTVSDPIKPSGTLALADLILESMAEYANARKINCTVARYCRTRIFDFPGAQIIDPVKPQYIYESDSLRASVVCDLTAYLNNSSFPHYSLSPSLRHNVAQECKNLETNCDGIQAYVVIEECDLIPSLKLQPRCAVVDEVSNENPPRPILLGGRPGKRFILAINVNDAPQPSRPRNDQKVNMVLAAVRACQNTVDVIAKRVDEWCLVTDDNQFVEFFTPALSKARGTVRSIMNAAEFRRSATDIKDTIAKIEAEVGSGHIEILCNSLYWENYQNDDFRRLHYLNLWQSLSESRKKLGYPHCLKKFRNDTQIIAGDLSIKELTDYRNDIAHYWESEIDVNKLNDIYLTVNKLLRQNYSG